MIFNRKLSPFVFVLFSLFACTNANQNDQYTLRQKAGNIAEKNQEYAKAIRHYSKARSYCKENENDRIVYVLGKIAHLQQEQSDYAGAEATATEALPYFDGCKDPIYKVGIWNVLGICAEEAKQYDQAISEYQKCLSVAKDSIARLTVKNNIGVVYLEQKKYAKAITVFQPLTAKVPKDSLELVAKVYDNLGYALYKNGDSILGMPYLKKALMLRETENRGYELTASYMHFAEVYQSDPLVSKNYALKAYKAATVTGSGDDQLEALNHVITHTKQVDSLKYYFALYHHTNDSINMVRQVTKNQFAKQKYDYKSYLQKYELAQTKNYLYITFMLLIGGMASLVIVAIRRRNREKIKTISYETETRIAKKIHDELANDVFNALTYAESQNLNEHDKKETLLDTLDTIYHRTRNISQENSEIHTDARFAVQLSELLQQYQSDTVRVILKNFSSVDWDVIKKESKIALYRVLQELMVNMKKHSRCSFVALTFEMQKNQLLVVYKDNGVGAELLKSKKGLQNAENRMDAINGRITFDTEVQKGFQAEIIIPK